jgi:tyrosine phenol-lyase
VRPPASPRRPISDGTGDCQTEMPAFRPHSSARQDFPLEEALDEGYLKYRIVSTAYLGRHIAQNGVPIVQPPGGRAIYIDARAFLPQIPAEEFPGVALAAELYLEGGIRSVEIGTLMFAEHAAMDLVRLAIPRRVYTQSHIDYVIEVILEVWNQRHAIRGLKLTYEASFLRHFTAHLEPL